jgi:hypothetical protein
MKKGLSAILLFGLLSAGFYPFAFEQGVRLDKITYLNNSIYLNGDLIAWDITEIETSNGSITGLKTNSEAPVYFYNNATIIFQNESFIRRFWMSDLNKDHERLALSVMWSINGKGDAICSEKTYGDLAVLTRYPNKKEYDLLIRNAIKMYSVFYPNQINNETANGVWEFKRVFKYN